MQQDLDCLFIGHNAMEFSEYEASLSVSGKKNNAYRELSLNFINHKKKPTLFADLFNEYIDDSIDKFSMTETFSAAIAYLCTYLNKNRLSFDYINSFQDQKSELADKLKNNNYACIAITTTLYVTVIPIIEIINFVREHNPNAKIILGGPFVTTQVGARDKESLDYLFSNILDVDVYIYSSQGESTLVKVINALKTNHSLSNIENLFFKKDDDLISTNLIKEDNLLSENLVQWDLLNPNDLQNVHLRTAISCPFTCAFCNCPKNAGSYQYIDVDCICRELEQLKQINKLKSIYIIDDTFNVPVKRYKEFLRTIIEKDYNFKWHSYFRCQFADEEMVDLMKESGCVGVYLGIESGNNTILKNMNKSATIEKYHEGVSLLKKYNIITHGSFVVGFPGETDDTIKDTINVINTFGLDFYRAQLWYCDTNTPIWEDREKYNLRGSQFEWEHATMNSNTASDYVEKIFNDVRDVISVPTHNFDFHNLLHLKYRGISTEKVKSLLGCFNDGIRLKLKGEEEVPSEIIENFKCILSKN